MKTSKNEATYFFKKNHVKSVEKGVLLLCCVLRLPKRTRNEHLLHAFYRIGGDSNAA